MEFIVTEKFDGWMGDMAMPIKSSSYFYIHIPQTQ